MRELLNEVIGNMKLHHNKKTTIYITVFEDNNGAIKLVLSPSITLRNKNFATNYTLFRRKLSDGAHIQINRVNSQYNIADISTKGF